jgi:hypothetical protein
LSHERSDVGAESFYSLEGNMCDTAMPRRRRPVWVVGHITCIKSAGNWEVSGLTGIALCRPASGSRGSASKVPLVDAATVVEERHCLASGGLK